MTARTVSALGCGVALLLALPACAQQEPEAMRPTALEAWRTGQYDRAISLYRRLAATTPVVVDDQRALVRVLGETGALDDAVATARRLRDGASEPAELETVLGEALVLSGKREAAESAFARAINGRASDRLIATVHLGVLLEERGRRADAWDLFRSVDAAVADRGGRATPSEFVALGTAYRHLGVGDPQYPHAALRAFDRAVTADSGEQEARIRVGELFLEKFQPQEAVQSFREVLRVNPQHARAHLGLAENAYSFEYGDPSPHLDSALAENPKLVPAIVMRARLQLDREDYAGAQREAETALDIDPVNGPALAMLAASFWLRGDTAAYQRTQDRALAHNSRDADFFADLAEVAARNRYYRQARDLAADGVARDSLGWRALTQLGVNELRVGQMQAGRTHLERAFAGDPFHLLNKNTLDLLDALDKYGVYRSPRFEIYADSSEIELLGPYAAAIAEEAYDSLAARYRYRPPTPIRLEIYRSHADFSVRTVSLPGLGALGVSFGTVLAMDSPSARAEGDFNWASTLWHEIGHTFTLGVTQHRVPRWLSEGLSVLEERRARPNWGAKETLGFLAALKGDRLLPVSRLNDGFVRPTYPGQIQHSYYEASLVSEYVEEQWGADGIRRLLAAYRDGAIGREAFPRAVGMSVEDLDGAFDQWLRTRFHQELDAISSTLANAPPRAAAPQIGRPVPTTDVNPGDFIGNLRAGRYLFDQGNRDQAIKFLERAKALFPGYAEADSPYWYLAQIALAKGDTTGAVAELQALVGLAESAYDPNLLLAELFEARHDTAGALTAFERVLWIQPGDRDLHRRLAELASAAGRHQLAVRERRAILATHPVDRADAEYQLALALRDAGDVAEARRAVLRALEIAPGFVDAQNLLLALRRGGDR